MSEVNTPLFNATGALRIIDKNGKVKREYKIKNVVFPKKAKDKPEEADKDEN